MSSSEDSSKRRALLKSMVVSGGALGAAHIAPGNWTRPVVKATVLPVHAGTSMISDGDFSGGGVSSVCLTCEESSSVLDLLVPVAHAGGISQSTTVDVCANVENGVLISIHVRINQESNPILGNCAVGPFAIPTGSLELPALAPASSASAQVTGPGNNGLAGTVTLGDGENTFVYAFDIGLGDCAFSIPK